MIARPAPSSAHADADFRLKVVQLEELLAIRHCVFIMGAAGAGKSACWQTLAGAHTPSKASLTKWWTSTPR